MYRLKQHYTGWYLVSCDNQRSDKSNVSTIVTKDLSEALQLPFSLANTIKSLYNKAYPDDNRLMILEAV